MKQTYLYGATALGLLFSACSSDDHLLPDESRPLESDQNYYVSLRISGDVLGTRAANEDGNPIAIETDFANGEGNESAVRNVYFVFYDNEGNVIGDVTSVDSMDDDGWTTDVTTGTVEKYYKSVVKVSVAKGEKQPTQVICYINPVNAGNLNVHLRDIQTLQLETAVKGGTIFPMSNSVYYPTDDADTPSIAVPLTMDVNLFTDEAKAEAANAANNCAEIYVERYATKLSFDATKAEQTNFVTGQRVWDSNGEEKTSVNKITLHFNPQYWAVNAEAKTTYVIKSFRQEAATGNNPLPDNYSFATLNERINNGLSEDNEWNWNAPSFHRSYWGMSPAYFTQTYPEVSSDLDPNHSELQKYISYNELMNATNGIGFKADVTTSQYFKETTVGTKALESKNPAAAVASVIYVGQYGVKLNETDLPDGTGFYTYLNGPVPDDSEADNQPYIYFENKDNSIESKVEGGENMLKRFLIQCSVLYKKVGNEYKPYELGDGTGFNSLTDILSVSELTEDEKKAYDPSTETVLKLQHNARTLRFTKVPEDQDIYILTYEGYKKVSKNVVDTKTEINLINANVALARNVGYALYYTSGHAYFNIPVKHFGWYRKGNENKDNAQIDWSKVRVGDFGMVRNHYYSITVDHITGLASGIGGDDVELVPPSSSLDYYMSYRVNILKWAVVPTQAVDL